MLFNYLLVAVFDLGVEGAAWATNIGMFVYTLLGWIYFGKGFSFFKTKALLLGIVTGLVYTVMGIPMLQTFFEALFNTKFARTVIYEPALNAKEEMTRLEEWDSRFMVSFYESCFCGRRFKESIELRNERLKA